MDELTLGVVATSAKEDERPMPIHSRRLGRANRELRGRMFFERGDPHRMQP